MLHLRTATRLTLIGLAASLTTACASSDPREAPASGTAEAKPEGAKSQGENQRTQQPKKSIAREAIEILDPRQKAYQEAGSTAATAREKIGSWMLRPSMTRFSAFTCSWTT